MSIHDDELTAFVPFALSHNGRTPMARMKRFVIEVPDAFAPAFKSAVEEMSNTLGTRLESQHKYDKQDALTFASASFGILRAAVSAQVPEGDKHYA